MSEQDSQRADQLLAEIHRDEARAKLGRLKVFFGASAGVGKTYSMLEAARSAHKNNVDVVCGYVEPHGRAETERLLEGLEQLPFLEVEYHGIKRREFDLDAALKRKPATLLVDELAHSNLVDGTPAPRHAKRWQDIEELLQAGINVWTTLNVQHLESLNDLVAGITGIQQQETVPDRIFDEADEVELVDLPPEELLARLRAGKVYNQERVATATERFFRVPNLLALRELALRRTADRVDAAAREYAGRERTSQPWLARDRFLIAVSPNDQAEQLVRFGKRFADALDAEWLVVSVETPRLLNLGESARNRRVDSLRLAESLGAQTVTLDGSSASAALIEYARVRNVTRIVVGEPQRSGWRALLRPSTATKLVREARGIDVSVIARRVPEKELPERDTGYRTREAIRWWRYTGAFAITLLCTGAAALMYPTFELTNLVMVYLLGTTVSALRLGRGPSTLTAIASVAAFDFFFVPTRYTFAVADLQYLVTFAVMLAVALIIATLVANVRAQTRVAGARQRRTSLLYAMSRELTATRSVSDLARVSVRHVAETFASEATVLLPDASGRLRYPRDEVLANSFRGADLSVAQVAFDQSIPTGLGTDTLPGAKAQYLPLKGVSQTLGVLAVLPTQRRRLLLPEQRHLLETFAGQIALAIERSNLASAAEAAHVRIETESLRNTLLASISHDLRTPLAVITGASSALSDPTVPLDEQARKTLIDSIERTAHGMADIVTNVIDLMRFEGPNFALRRDWESVDDLAGVALNHLERSALYLSVEFSIPDDLPLVYVDGILITQVFQNLLDNALKHTPPETRVRITAILEHDYIQVCVEDNGPGLPGKNPERLFAKFARGRDEDNTRGAGLGLAICRAIVSAHGQTIVAGQSDMGGAKFAFGLPTREVR